MGKIIHLPSFLEARKKAINDEEMFARRLEHELFKFATMRCFWTAF